MTAAFRLLTMEFHYIYFFFLSKSFQENVRKISTKVSVREIVLKKPNF